MTDDPLVIKIPKGVTEIDLRPILEPIVLALMGDIQVNAHSSRQPMPADVGPFIQNAIDQHAYRLLLPTIDHGTFKAYLDANDWKSEHNGTRYIKWGDYVHLMASEYVFNTGFHYRDEAVRRINTTDFYGKPKLEVARLIKAYHPVLDQLAELA